jgi:SAM-dependent methyltransferase
VSAARAANRRAAVYTSPMDLLEHNREAWTREVESGNKWTIPVDSAAVEKARRGEWELLLTPTIPVPRDWCGSLPGAKVLCLASGGGQQGPLLAAAGARVTVFDNCPSQLERDGMVAEREGLGIELAQGDMRDLSRFAEASFDLVFHPVSNCFVDDAEIVWRECARVVKPGGRLLAGFCNPGAYIFDLHAWGTPSALQVKYSIPYSDLGQLPPEELAERIEGKQALEYGHSLDSQIGGQIKAGFAITGFYEDIANGDLLDPYIKTFIATCAVRV